MLDNTARDILSTDICLSACDFFLLAIFSLSLSSARAKEPDFALVCKLYAPYCLPLDIAY